MKRARATAPLRVGLLGLALAAQAAAQPAPAPASAADVASEPARPAEYCGVLLSAPWPRTASARRTLLHRLEIQRAQCMGHAVFLAAYGALWLEEGEPAQALIWLERSLLLNPEQLGALADHALALSALGDHSARETLREQWALRTDVPAALRQRLELDPPLRAALGARKPAATTALSIDPQSPTLAEVDAPRWLFYREVSLLAGYETNLDNSPRLSELTLTVSDDGARQSLELLEPIVPRRGAAVLGEASFQLAHSPSAGTIWQTGLLASARHAPNHPDTDWLHVQWAASASRPWGPYRLQTQASVSQVGGRSSDAYRIGRLGLVIEREAIGCGHRASAEAELRRHPDLPRTDGRTWSILWNSVCPLSDRRWTGGLAVRASIDEPRDDQRPGGIQDQLSAAFRLSGDLGSRWRGDFTARVTRLSDRQGYSRLLENNARRAIVQVQLGAEVSRPWRTDVPNGAEWVIQLQAVKQSSNLAIFRHEGVSVFGGTKFRW